NEPQLACLSETTSSNVERYLKKLYMLFTLKQYSFAFTIQQYFTSSLIAYNLAACHGYLKYIPARLRFVFDNQWIERIYSQVFPMEYLFVDQCSKLADTFDFFYRTVWPYTRLKLKSEDLIVGVLQEYCKLCLWWKIDGRNLQIFRRIPDC